MAKSELDDWQRAVALEGEIYEVGGSVRDRFLKLERTTKDRDYLVRLIPARRLMEILERFGKVDRVGSSFGVLKFRPSDSDSTLDIALPRREISTGVGHRDFDVDFDPEVSLEDDLVRRDFTVNAIARNLVTGEIIDPCGGREDIEARTLRLTFDGAFQEDPLRMVRAAQFAARFGFLIEEHTWSRMQRSAGLVETLSAERIQEELAKLLNLAEKPSIGIVIMQKTGLLEIIIPELSRCKGFEQNEFHTHDLFFHSIYCCDYAPRGNLKVRLAALFHDLGKYETRELVECEGDGKMVFYGHQMVSVTLAGNILRRLRFSENLTNNVLSLIRHHMYNYTPDWSDAAVRRFIRRIGVGNLEDMFLLRRADSKANPKGQYDTSLDQELRDRVEAELAKEVPLSIKDLEVGGRDVMEALGIDEGPRVGEALSHLLEVVLEDPEKNERSILLEEMRTWGQNLK
jgi:tRNA nucleotidyltransferase/poly(A) polymerase